MVQILKYNLAAVTFFALISASYAQKGASGVQIPLQVRHYSQYNHLEFLVSGTLATDAHPESRGDSRLFVLDTGANRTVLFDDNTTAQFTPRASVSVRGYKGGTSCDLVLVPILGFGDFMVTNMPAVRCATLTGLDRDISAIIGMDLFRDKTFALDMTHLQLMMTQPGALDSAVKMLPMATRDPYIVVPITIGTFQAKAFFDTGTPISTVASDFIKQHPDLFVEISNPEINNVDATNRALPRKTYIAQMLQLGPYILENKSVNAVDFSRIKNRVGDADFIIGADMIARFNWMFDMKTGRWRLSLP